MTPRTTRLTPEPGTGRLHSTHIVKSGVPLTVFTEPSA